MNFLRGFIAIALVLITLQEDAAAFAQVERGLEIGPYAGGFRARGGTTRIIDARRLRDIRSRIAEKGLSGGFRAGYNLNRHLAIEAAFTGSTNNYFAQLRDLGSPVATDETNLLFLGHSNLVFHILRGRVVPYVSPGIGFLGTVDDAALALNYGGGFKVFVTRRISVRLEARQYLATLNGRLEQAVAGRDFSLVEIPERYRDKLRFDEVSLGLSFTLK